MGMEEIDDPKFKEFTKNEVEWHIGDIRMSSMTSIPARISENVTLTCKVLDFTFESKTERSQLRNRNKALEALHKEWEIANVLKETLETLFNEFNTKKGIVTCELSAPRHRVLYVKPFLETLISEYGKWLAYECETCRENYTDDYVHICIERHDVIADMEKEGAFLTHKRLF